MNISVQDQRKRLHNLLNSYPSLKWKGNKGERYPVTKLGIGSGSLWFRITKSNGTLAVTTTSEVTQHMSQFIIKCTGNPYNIEKAHRDWKNVSFDNVEIITSKFNSLKLV